MATFDVRKDIKITSTSDGTKNTLYLTNYGDISVADGREKLISQLIHAVVNDSTVLRDLINNNSMTVQKIGTLVNIILRNFKSTQVSEVDAIDLSFTGYYIYRRAAGSTSAFEKINHTPVTHYYKDTKVNNENSYDYGITLVKSTFYESEYIDKFTVSPTSISSNFQTIIGSCSVCLTNNSYIEFYVPDTSTIITSELLNSIVSIIPNQDKTEPRRYTVDITVKDLNDNIIAVSTKKIKP